MKFQFMAKNIDSLFIDVCCRQLNNNHRRVKSPSVRTRRDAGHKRIITI